MRKWMMLVVLAAAACGSETDPAFEDPDLEANCTAWCDRECAGVALVQCSTDCMDSGGSEEIAACGSCLRENPEACIGAGSGQPAEDACDADCG